MSGDPISIAVGLVREIWICVRRVKVYQRRCRNLAWRCNLLINALTENTAETVPDAMHDAEEVLLSVHRRVTEWADLNIMRSILTQQDISEGVDFLHQRIDTCIATYHVRIGYELVQNQRTQGLAAERDRNELRETLQHLQDALAQYTRETRTRGPYSLPRGAAAEEILRSIEEEIYDLQASTSGHDTFDHAIRSFSRSLETLSLRLPSDTNNPAAFEDRINPGLSNPMARGLPEGSRQTMLHLPFRVPGFPGSRRRSSVSLSCPQIPPLDFEDEVTEYFSRGTLSSSPLSARASILSEPSSPVSGYNSPPTGFRNGAPVATVSPISTGSSVPSESPSTLSRYSNSPPGSRNSTQAATASLISTASNASSPLEVALSTRTSMLLYSSGGNPRVIKKATMDGLIRYLLLNPADARQHDTFFMGHLAVISSQDVLRILIRQFDEALMYADDIHDMNVMRLLKNWLTNQNVIIPNDVLTEIQIFADAVNSSNALRELALEVLQCIPDKASLNFPLSSIISSFRPGPEPSPSQLAVALTKLERERYLSILPAEYIACALDLTSYCPNLHEAIALNKRITHWVMSSILQCGDVKSRANRKTFFVNAAEACQKIRNFSSMCIIVGALQSKSISCLDLTHKAMSHRNQRQYQKLTTLLKQESNYSTYRAAVQRNDQRGCIPWHGAHLHDIGVVLREADVEERPDGPLINFEKWTHLKEKALDALRYRDIPLEYDEDGLESAMAYLKQQLQPIGINDDFSQLLQIESTRLELEEEAMRRDAAMKSVGF